MAAAHIDDLFSLGNPGSLARRSYKGTISLQSNYSLPLFHSEEEYSSVEIYFRKNQGVLEHLETLKEICLQIPSDIPKRERFFSGLVEAVKNANEHGNKKDSTKKVSILYRTTEEEFEAVVSDQGGILRASFIPYVLLHRQGLTAPISYYRFDRTAKQNSGNGGIGTFILHASCDEVNYFRNSDGGLSVQIKVKRTRHNPKSIPIRVSSK